MQIRETEDLRKMTIVIKNRFNSAFSKLIGNLLDISEPEWRQALNASQFDKAAGIKHAKLHGSPEWRYHVAEITSKVNCHYHRHGEEVYEVVEGAGILHFGAVENRVRDGGNGKIAVDKAGLSGSEAINTACKVINSATHLAAGHGAFPIAGLAALNVSSDILKEAIEELESETSVAWQQPLRVKAGDSFVIPEGFAHQLVRDGDAPLTIIFACPDSHLADDRFLLPDSPLIENC